jgi:hypothetical protein
MGRKKSWHDQAEALKAEAEKLPYGKDREALETKARQLEIAANINDWLSSPGLQPPKLPDASPLWPLEAGKYSHIK